MPDGDSLIGTVLDGKYSVDRLLGRGGMGEVYAGTHVALGRLVAIKVLHAELTENQSFVTRFEREARTTAMLEHPNAVHVHDFGTLGDGSRYLVMEYIEGVTIREVLRANGSLPPGAAIDLIRQAASAVGEAHARGIIHRDLKPENMMVRRDAEGQLCLKVVDFGLAKMLENTASILTNASEIIGTPKYMAPEQFQGMPVDGRADVYALACVLFELLSGQTPYEGTILEIVGQHVHAEIPRLSGVPEEIPSAVEDAIRRAMTKDPAARTATAEEFALELQTAIAGDDHSAESLVIPGSSCPAFTETSDPSDVTALPGTPPSRNRPAPSVSSDTLAGAYSASPVGNEHATVFVPFAPAKPRAWRIAAAMGAAGVLFAAGLAWQNASGGGAGVTAGVPEAQPAPVSEPVLAAPPLPEPAREPAPRSSPKPTGEPVKAPPATEPTDPPSEKKDNRGVLPTVGAKTKDAVVGTGRQIKKLGGKIRRGIPGLKPKKNDQR